MRDDYFTQSPPRRIDPVPTDGPKRVEVVTETRTESVRMFTFPVKMEESQLRTWISQFKWGKWIDPETLKQLESTLAEQEGKS